jgi:hypothetical protein
MTAPITRLVFAVAQHLHMTAGAVRRTMGAHELMCWAYLLTEQHRPPDSSRALELSVEDEIAAWS